MCPVLSGPAIYVSVKGCFLAWDPEKMGPIYGREWLLFLAPLKCVPFLPPERGLCSPVPTALRWLPIFADSRMSVFSRILAKRNKINNTKWPSRSHYYLYKKRKKTLSRKGKTSTVFGKVQLPRGSSVLYSQCSPGLFRAPVLVIIAQVWAEFLPLSSSQNHLCFRIFWATNSICFQIERFIANVIPSVLRMGWKRERVK